VDVAGGSARERRAAHLYLRRLLREAPLTRSGYERATALVALMPGLRADFGFAVTPAPGVMRLKVTLHALRARFDLRITNRGAVSFGAWEGRADARAFSLFRGGDQAVLTVAATPDAHQLRLIEGTYVTPVGTDGLAVAVGATHVQADPYRAGEASDGTSVRAALIYPLLLRWDRALTVAAVADGQDGQTAAGPVTLEDERTRNLRLSLTGSRLFGRKTALGGVLLTQGVPVAGARAAHPGYAPTTYTKVAAYGGLATPYGPWTVRLHALAQTAGSRLPSSEQFALGGDDYGRGFQAVSLQGDDGVAASAELAVRLRHGLPSVFAGSELFAYVDGGEVRVRDRPGVRGGEGALASAGFGVRLGVGPGAGVELSADRQLEHTDPFGGPQRLGWRFGVRLHVAYAPGADAALRASDLTAPISFNPLAP
jgi:hemolysin activation/secretion protein